MRRALIGVAVAALATLTLTSTATASSGHQVAHALTGQTVTNDNAPGDPTLCSPTAFVRYSSAGSGVLSHLGRVWFEISHCTYRTGPTTGKFDQGKITVTAANGDKLFMNEFGTFVLTFDGSGAMSSVATVNVTITGGTGRFTHAGGSGHVMAVSTDLNKPKTSVTGTFYDTTITYDASDRR